MTVSINQPSNPSRGIYDLSWSTSLGGTPDFFIYRDADLIKTTTLTSYRVTVADGEAPVFSIFDVATDRPAGNSARAYLQWLYPQAGDVDYWKVEEWVDAAWVERKRITAKTSKLIYEFWSRTLEDSTSHQFRITPVGINKNPGDATSFTLFMIRTPDPPDVAYSYNGGTKLITVSAV